MLSRAVVLAVLTSLGVAAPVSAHETIPADWCPVGSTPVILSEFTLSPDHLREYRERYDCVQAKTCGIIDEWFMANDAAGTYCSGLGLRSAPAEDAIPFVSSPKSFNALDHHGAYGFDDGPLRGQCVVCRPSQTPAIPIPATPPSAD